MLKKICFAITLVLAIGFGQGIFFTTSNPSTPTVKCFGNTLSDGSGNSTSETDICVVGLVTGLVVAIAVYPYYLGSYSNSFASKRRDQVPFVQFRNPETFEVAQPSQEYPVQKRLSKPYPVQRRPSLKDKLTQAVDQFAARFSKIAENVKQPAEKAIERKVVVEKKEEVQQDNKE